MKPNASTSHLIKSAILGTKAEKDKDDAGEDKKDAAAPENDKEDGKDKGGKKGGKNSGKKTGKGKDGTKCDDDDDNDPGMTAEEENEEDEDDNEEEGEDDKKDDKEKDGKKGKKAKSASAARQNERERCRAIVEAGIGGDDGKFACALRLAFHSSLSVPNATAIIQGMPASASGGRSTIDDRMNSVTNPQVGIEGPEGAPAASGKMTEAKLKAMTPGQRALAIVNAGRANRNEEPLKQIG